jgi:hypothetical protein
VHVDQGARSQTDNSFLVLLLKNNAFLTFRSARNRVSPNTLSAAP